MATNPLLSKLKVGNTTYDIKDTYAQEEIEKIKAAIAGGVKFLGVSVNAIEDGQTITALTVKDGSGTKTIPVADIHDGCFTVYGDTAGSLEFIAAGGKWYELGSTGKLKALAFADTASATYTPEGTVTTVEKSVTGDITTNVTAEEISGLTSTFVGKSKAVSVSGTPSGTVTGTLAGTASVNIPEYTPAGTISGTVNGSATISMDDYQPEGTVDAPTVTFEEGEEDSECAADALVVSENPYTAATETLELGSASFLKGNTVATATAPTFTGTSKKPTVASATTTATVETTDLTFAGTKKVASTATGTCETDVDGSEGHALEFAGDTLTSSGTYQPEAESVTLEPFTPELDNGTVTHTLKAPGQTVSLAGTEATITVTPDTAS